MRHPALQGKRDANEFEIVAALEARGAFVLALAIGGGVPDLLVWYRGVLYFLEVKTKTGRLNAKQIAWIAAFPGEVHVVRTILEAFDAVGIAVSVDERFRMVEGQWK